MPYPIQSRQKLIMILGAADNHVGVSVNDLADAIGLSQPATSHHLKHLKDIGMVGSAVKAIWFIII